MVFIRLGGGQYVLYPTILQISLSLSVVVFGRTVPMNKTISALIHVTQVAGSTTHWVVPPFLFL